MGRLVLMDAPPQSPEGVVYSFHDHLIKSLLWGLGELMRKFNFRPLTSRIILLILPLLFGVGVLPGQHDEVRFKVVASSSIFSDMAEVISGGMVEVKMVVPIGGDPHIYEPTPADVMLVAGADLVLINGLTFEGWMIELIEKSGTKVETVVISEGLQAIVREENVNSSDPHAWMSAENGLIYAANVRDALIRLDPENAEIYRFNAGLYSQEIQDLDNYIQGQIARVPEPQRVLITSYDAFRYYGRRYGIRVVAALETSTNAEVQTDDVARLTKIIRDNGVKAIFVESTMSPKLIRQIATDNEVTVGGSLYADSLSDADSPASTYLKMLRHNTDIIVKGLMGEAVDKEVDIGPGHLLSLILAVMLGAFLFIVYRLNRGIVST